VDRTYHISYETAGQCGFHFRSLAGVRSPDWRLLRARTVPGHDGPATQVIHLLTKRAVANHLNGVLAIKQIIKDKAGSEPAQTLG